MAPTCSGCASSAWSPTAASARAASPQAIDVAARGRRSEDVIGRTRAALEQAGALRSAAGPVDARSAGRRLVRASGYGVEPMTREEIFPLIRGHLADELEVDPDRITESTRFKEDLEADSLDLYTLVQELEDSYGVRISDEQAATILTVGQAVDFVLRERRGAAFAGAATASQGPDAELSSARAPHAAGRAPRRPGDVGVHALVVDHAALALLRAPGVPGRQRAGAGRDLAPVPAARGRALRPRPADQDPRPGGLGPLVPRGRRAPRDARAAERGGARRGWPSTVPALVSTERVLASVIEAVIGACFLAFGYERTAEAVVEAFAPEIEDALEHRSTSSRRSRSGSPARARWSATTSSTSRARRTTGCSRSAPRSPASRSGAAAGGARRTPSRRPPRWRWRRSNDGDRPCT